MGIITHLQQTGIDYPQSIIDQIDKGILTQTAVHELLIQCRDLKIDALQKKLKAAEALIEQMQKAMKNVAFDDLLLARSEVLRLGEKYRSLPNDLL